MSLAIQMLISIPVRVVLRCCTGVALCGLGLSDAGARLGRTVGTYHRTVIFITAKFHVLPEHADHWVDITQEFTQATRDEPGNLWFDWSRSIDDPTEYVLVEAFRDGDAGAAHVQSDHFKAAIVTLPKYLVKTPQVISQMIDQDDWSELGEMKVS